MQTFRTREYYEYEYERVHDEVCKHTVNDACVTYMETSRPRSVAASLIVVLFFYLLFSPDVDACMQTYNSQKSQRALLG